MEPEQTEKKEIKCKHSHSPFWGVVLLVLGFVFLADNMGWLYIDLPFWPIVMIIGGAYLIYSSRNKN